MPRRSDPEISRPNDHIWARLQRAASPRLAYRLAAWRPPALMAGGRLMVHAPERGSARLSYRVTGSDDRAACLRRQSWALGIPASRGASRVTLEENACAAHGDSACE